MLHNRPLSYQPDEFIPPEKKKNNKFATAGLFLGAAGILLLSFGALSPFGNAVVDIAGIIFSIKGFNSSKRLSAVTGLVASSLCLLIAVAWYIYRIVYLKK